MKNNIKSIVSIILLILFQLFPSVSYSEESDDLSKLFGGKSEFLKVDEAFKLNTEIVDNEIIVKFDIADEYYLYRSRFFFNAEGATLEEAYIPDGKKKVDEYLGKVEVYYHNLEISIPFVTDKKNFTFSIEFQGCADAGLCYPPEEKIIPLVLPNDTFIAKAAANEEFVPEQEKLSNFLSDKKLYEIVLYMILLGIGLAFTPCVLPMVPILSSIIVGQGNNITTRKSFLLSLTYTQSMAIPFAGIGLFVGGASELFGVDINSESLQSSWFIVPAALIFLLLSLSMFGFYELQLPAGIRNRLSNLSNKQEGGTLVGAGAMGFLSALVVSPCVTVPVAGILLYIAQTGDAVIGGVALYSLAVGMGIPLLLVGVGGGKILPKAGAWMNAVKAAFGVGMIAMALYISKHLIPATLNLVLWSVLLVVSATYMGALSRAESNIAKLWKGIGLVIFIYGLLLLVGASMGNSHLLKPLKGLSFTPQSVSSKASNTIAIASDSSTIPTHTDSRFIRVKTIQDVERQVAAANAEGKTVMFDFFSVSCTACYEFEELVFPDPAVVSALSNSVLIQADVTNNDVADKALRKHFGIIGLPSILFFDKNGFEDKRLRAIGLEDAEIFVKRINAAYSVNL